MEHIRNVRSQTSARLQRSRRSVSEQSQRGTALVRDMEHREDPTTGRAFHSVDLSSLPLDALAVLAQGGDELALCTLWKRCDGIARAIARARGAHDDHEWREALGDAFLVCCDRFDAQRGTFGAFFAIVFGHVLSGGRQRAARWTAKHAMVEEIGEADAYRAWLADDHERIDYESSVLVRAAVATVAEFESATRRRRDRRRWAAIAQLQLVEKLPTAEIAARLGITAKDVHNCVGRHIRPAARRHAHEIRIADACDAENNPEPVNLQPVSPEPVNED